MTFQLITGGRTTKEGKNTLYLNLAWHAAYHNKHVKGGILQSHDSHERFISSQK